MDCLSWSDARRDMGSLKEECAQRSNPRRSAEFSTYSFVSSHLRCRLESFILTLAWFQVINNQSKENELNLHPLTPLLLTQL